MQHDDKLWRLVELMERDIARMLDNQAARVAGFDDVDFDPLHGLITYVGENRRLWTAQVEAIGTYSADVSMFRWSWSAYERPAGRARLNVVFAEGQRLGITSLTSAQTHVQDEDHAIRLAHAAAALARASGVYRTREPHRLTFYAMFEVSAGTEERLAHSPLPPSVRAGSRFPPAMTRAPSSRPPPRGTGESVYPAPMQLSGAAHLPKPARAPIMSMLPPPPPVMSGAEAALPNSRDRWFDADSGKAAVEQPTQPPREPSRDMLMPIANMALTAVVAAVPQGFVQAVLVVDVTVAEARARFSAVLVALDLQGDLVALATPQAVMDAVGAMILEDVKSGNGRWKRLLIRLIQKEHRVTLRVHVTG